MRARFELCLAGLLLCAGFLARPAVAQTKVAIVNLNNAIAETAEIKAENAKLEVKYGARQKELEALSKELQDIEAKLQQGQNTLSPQAYQELLAQGQRKQRQLQRMQEDLQADFNRDRQAILDRAGRQIQEVIRKLAEEKGIDLIIDAGDALYFKSALEITAEVTAAYDKAYPAQPPASGAK